MKWREGVSDALAWAQIEVPHKERFTSPSGRRQTSASLFPWAHIWRLLSYMSKLSSHPTPLWSPMPLLYPWRPSSQKRLPGRDEVLTGAQWWSGQSRWRGRRARHRPRRHRIGHPPAWSTERAWRGGGVESPGQPAPTPFTPDTAGLPAPDTWKARSRQHWP